MFEGSLLHTMRDLRDGSLTASELTTIAIDHHERRGAALDAYKTWAPERAMRDAETADRLFRAGIDLGPLQGIPISVKDLFGVAGLPTFAGTARRLPRMWEAEGPLVARLRKQLGVVTGKTHTVELAFGGLGVNDHWGTPRNPWDATEHRVPGGSSAGAGVSLCEGSALLALGTDTAGSVRIPAAMTGNVGLKITKGRWSTDGIVPLSPTLDTPGMLARSVEDIAIAFAALDPSDVPLERVLGEGRAMTPSALRVGVIADSVWEACPTDVEHSVRDALRELSESGATLVDVHLPEAQEALELLHSGSVVSAECDEFVEAELPEWRPLLGPVLKMRIDDGARISGREFLNRLRSLRRLASRGGRCFEDVGVDLLVLPTLPITAPTVREVSDHTAYRRINMVALRNTCLANYLGLCAMTLPVGLDGGGLPIALQVLAPAHSERYLIAAARAMERLLGTPAERIGVPSMFETT